MRFFGARSPSKIAYIGAEGAFRKILGSVGQKWISEKYQRGDPLGRQGVKSLKGGVRNRRPPPPPKSAPVENCSCWKHFCTHVCPEKALKNTNAHKKKQPSCIFLILSLFASLDAWFSFSRRFCEWETSNRLFYFSALGSVRRKRKTSNEFSKSWGEYASLSFAKWLYPYRNCL